MRSGLRIERRAEKKLAIAYHFERTGVGRQTKQFDCGECKRLKLHKKRNCRFFPAEWLSERKETAWIAQYQHRDRYEHNRRISGQPSQVRSTLTTECPTSYITPDSKYLLSEYFAAGAAHREFGAIRFGTDPDHWPAWWFDVVTTIAHAKYEAESIEMTEK